MSGGILCISSGIVLVGILCSVGIACHKIRSRGVSESKFHDRASNNRWLTAFFHIFPSTQPLKRWSLVHRHSLQPCDQSLSVMVSQVTLSVQRRADGSLSIARGSDRHASQFSSSLTVIRDAPRPRGPERSMCWQILCGQIQLGDGKAARDDLESQPKGVRSRYCHGFSGTLVSRDRSRKNFGKNLRSLNVQFPLSDLLFLPV